MPAPAVVKLAEFPTQQPDELAKARGVRIEVRGVTGVGLALMPEHTRHPAAGEPRHVEQICGERPGLATVGHPLGDNCLPPKYT